MCGMLPGLALMWEVRCGQGAGMCISLQDVLDSLSDCSAQSAILVAM